MHYLDLMTQANLLDHHVWTNPDTWNSALEYTAKKKSSKKGGSVWIFAAVCCIGVIALILGIVYLMTNKKKNQGQ
ncbi:hypothetical protein GFY24_02035 [Nocardia sp. SYP-A9097]|uniref:hypothetical protein n=1 Tax=Nocardia sp. SYP-A9097 TaxID=2663237 RepID=UPI00129A8CD6|nr:hypothetical protein [Nocardia sp. SYP-A9097]MRH86257.1 hypothetical protein [Nocardia sp. SYP-A9097]